MEGLASFFEATEVMPNGDVVVGKIPLYRMRSLQRAIHDGTDLRLRTVLHTPRLEFSGFHYDHAWGVIHWLMYGPDSKKSQKLLNWFWARCAERPARAEDFEDGLAQMGYSMDRFEQALHQRTLRRSHRDPRRNPRPRRPRTAPPQPLLSSAVRCAYLRLDTRELRQEVLLKHARERIDP
jgi:hypothetical protein